MALVIHDSKIGRGRQNCTMLVTTNHRKMSAMELDLPVISRFSFGVSLPLAGMSCPSFGLVFLLPRRPFFFGAMVGLTARKVQISVRDG